MFARMIQYLKESRAELAKITWPSRQELRGSTVVVIVSVILLTIFIGVVDQIFNYLLKILVRSL
jgi:preprotein translocase subunit SecE